MRFALTFTALTALSALSGCSSIDTLRDAWNWDVTQPQPRLVLSGPVLSELRGRIAQMRQERDAIRARVSAEPSLKERQKLYEELHGLGLRMAPLERRLAATVATR